MEPLPEQDGAIISASTGALTQVVKDKKKKKKKKLTPKERALVLLNFVKFYFIYFYPGKIGKS